MIEQDVSGRLAIFGFGFSAEQYDAWRRHNIDRLGYYEYAFFGCLTEEAIRLASAESGAFEGFLPFAIYTVVKENDPESWQGFVNVSFLGAPGKFKFIVSGSTDTPRAIVETFMRDMELLDLVGEHPIYCD